MMKPNFWLATFVGVALTLASAALGQTVQIADLQPGRIVGTVTDINNDTIPDAIVVLDGSATTDQRRIATDENGYFEFVDVKAGAPYRVSIHAEGFADWTSPVVVLEPGQCKMMTDIQLRIAMAVTTVQVTYDPVQVATEQVKMQEKQRVLGFIPNFYVVYDRDPAPMTAKLKFQLAFKVVVDPVTATGIAFYSGIEQAGDRPNYGQGAQGFGKRVGANAAGGFTDIMIGGAILPSLLHQDPRYFYKGTGTTMSRMRYAMSRPFICKGDDGKWQPNYSSIGGDLGSSAISYAYFPKSDGGVAMVFTNFAINTGERIVASLAQEFVLGRFTHRAGISK